MKDASGVSKRRSHSRTMRPGERARLPSGVAAMWFAPRVQVVDAFFAAAQGGDFDALVAVLDPDVVSRIDAGAGALIPSGVLHGAATVARQTLAIASISAPKHPVLVNGAAGVVITLGGQPVSVMSFTVSGGKIVEINSIVDPERLRQFDFSVLGP